MNKNVMRLVSAIAGTTLALSAGALVPSVAFAQPSITAPSNTTVNLDADVSLTINKYIGELGNTANPRDAVDFQIEKIATAAPLDTAAGWAEVAGLNAASVSGDVVATLTTDAAGAATISSGTNPDFTVGVYKITELQNGQFTVATPFLVSLPFVDEDSGQWSYSQVVEPKNQESQPSKTVVDAAQTLGQNFAYTINAPVPAEELSFFEIVDNLSNDLGQATDVGIAVSAGPALVAGDYTLITDESNPAGTDTNQMRITFTDAGRAKLEAARVDNPDLAVTVSFVAPLLSIPESGRVDNHVTLNLPNGARVTSRQTAPGSPYVPTNPGNGPENPYNPGMPDPNNPNDPFNPGTGVPEHPGNGPTPPAEEDPHNPGSPIPKDPGNPGAQTLLGNLTINKTTDSENEDLSLEGAEFQFYRCADGDNDDRFDVTGDPLEAATVANSAASVTDTFVIGTGNNVVLHAVQAYDWVDNAAESDSTYCVVETKAPEGFALNPEPQAVQFIPTAEITDDNYAMFVNVVNHEDTIIGRLPNTGGLGALIIIGAGLAVAAAGGAVAVRGNRSRNEA